MIRLRLQTIQKYGKKNFSGIKIFILFRYVSPFSNCKLFPKIKAFLRDNLSKFSQHKLFIFQGPKSRNLQRNIDKQAHQTFYYIDPFPRSATAFIVTQKVAFVATQITKAFVLLLGRTLIPMQTKKKSTKKIEEIKVHLLYTGTSEHRSPRVPFYFQIHNAEPP